MPVPIQTALADAEVLSAAKAAGARDLPRYLLSSALAGAYVGVAVVLLISVSAPLVAAASPLAKLVQSAVFGIALVLVVFAGAELFTGNAMVMAQGLRARTIRGRDLAVVWTASLVGNLVGSVAFAAAVHGGGTFSRGPQEDLVDAMVSAKVAASGGQLFWRALLCNLLVCLALWMAARTASDGAKIAVLWFALMAFVGSGFEHSVANMTIFSLGILEGHASAGDLVRNLLWTVPGNVAGGGLVVGVGYSWLAGPRTAAAISPAVLSAAPREPDLV